MARRPHYGQHRLTAAVLPYSLIRDGLVSISRKVAEPGVDAIDGVQGLDLVGPLTVFVSAASGEKNGYGALWLKGRASAPRHFSRRFKQVFGTTPGTFVEALRLDEAGSRLADHRDAIKGVCASVGFKGAWAFGRAFERRFGLDPSSYGTRFAVHSKPALNESKGAHS